MVGVAGVEHAPNGPGSRSVAGPPGDGGASVTTCVTKDRGDASAEPCPVADDEGGEEEEEPPSPARLAAALGVLRRLRNDMGTSVFGADADLVDRLLSGGRS